MSDPNTKSPIDLTGTHTVISNEELEATRSEVHAWFFEDYLPRWVAASSGKSGEGSFGSSAANALVKGRTAKGRL